MSKFRSLSEAKTYIKDNVDLASWVSKHTKLVKSGDGFKGKCPLPGHAEKTPSFHVNTRHNFFHCFGCDRSGDIFTFLQFMEGLGFKEALERVAETMHVELPRFKEDDKNPKQKDRFRSGYELMHRAATYYNRILIEGATPGAKRAQNYLKTRGIDDAWIEKFQLGWAPEEPQSLAKKLADKEEQILAQEVGLIRNYNGVNYDFFQNRLMIPIHNDRSRVVAFSGRTLDAVAEKNPKYKNSPETFLFKKKEVLYGYSQIQDLLREKEYAVFVEGFFDQWALARCGIPAMAVMGTALTEEHLKLVERWTRHLILMMDSDEAGKRSVLRSLPLLLGKQFETKVFSVPSGKDPDEWLKDPKAASNAENILKKAPEALEWWAQLLILDGEEKRLNRLQILNRLQEVWEWTPNLAHRNFLSMQLAPRLGMRPKDFVESLNGITPPQNFKVKGTSNFSSSSKTFFSETPHPVFNLTSMDKATEAPLLWWIRFWEQLTPKSHSDWDQREALFSSTLAEDLVHSWSQAFFHAHGSLPREFIKTSLESESLEPIVKQWIIKGFVDGIESSQSIDADQIKRDWDELVRHLQIEKLRAQVNVLKQKVKIESENPETSAQLLQQITELTQKLNNYLEK